MSEAHEEPLNVYDSAGVVVGVMPRAEAKRSGLAVGAVNVLLANAGGEVLLQRRPADKENAGLWDKSVGGHVAGGEEFDRTAVRERSSSPGSARPPGKPIWPDQGSPSCSARRMNRISRPGAPSRRIAATAARDATGSVTRAGSREARARCTCSQSTRGTSPL